MAVKSLIPYYDDRNVREEIDKLFSREMLGAVIVGKFVGDFTAILFTDFFILLVGNEFYGEYIGYLFGIIVAIALFIYWHIVEKKAEQAKEKVNIPIARTRSEDCGMHDDRKLFV